MDEYLLQKKRDHEEDLQRLRGFRPIDDTFMRCLFKDNLPLAQFVLRIITGKDDLVLTREETQKDLKRLVGARSICLDVHGEDSEGRQYDLEVQRDDSGAEPDRARYHASAMDIENLDAGQDFEKLPETYVIFVTETDVFEVGLGLYTVERVIHPLNVLFGDRQHILYANASYKGDDPLGLLMHDFLCNDPDDMKLPEMADRTRYLKETQKGVDTVCKVMEEMREQTIVRTQIANIKKLMENLKLTAKQAMDALGIPEADQAKYAAQL